MNELTTILFSGGFSVVLVSALTFLFRDWISNRIKGAIQYEYDEKLRNLQSQLDQKLETHRAKVQAESEVAVVKLSNALEIAATERSIKLTKVFQDQADVIVTIYSHLVAILNAIKEYTSMMEFANTASKAERRVIVGNEIDTFLRYYRPRRIFLPKDIQEHIDTFVNDLHKKVLTFKWLVEDKLQGVQSQQTTDTWFETVEYLKTDCEAIMRELDSKFKVILGMEETRDKENPSIIGT